MFSCRRVVCPAKTRRLRRWSSWGPHCTSWWRNGNRSSWRRRRWFRIYPTERKLSLCARWTARIWKWVLQDTRKFLLNIFQVFQRSEAVLKEFKPRRWSAKNRFQLSAVSNLVALNIISSETNHVWTATQILIIKCDNCWEVV